MVSDPWQTGSVSNCSNSGSMMFFDDDFISVASPATAGDSITGGCDHSYVALEDSVQYLTRLQTKLGRMTGSQAEGATATIAAASSKSLLAGLAAARQCQHHSLLTAGADSLTVVSEEDYCRVPKGKGIMLLPTGGVGGHWLQRVAPDRLALTAEELLHLLPTDTSDICTTDITSTSANTITAGTTTDATIIDTTTVTQDYEGARINTPGSDDAADNDNTAVAEDDDTAG